MLPPGLGKDNHMALAGDLPSPFAFRPWPELDVAFVSDAIATWRVDVFRLCSGHLDVCVTPDDQHGDPLLCL